MLRACFDHDLAIRRKVLCLQGFFVMQPLDDGTYDAFIIDAEDERDDEKEIRVMRLEITITSGARKGEVVAVRARGLTRDAIQLIGLPATLIVTDGMPNVRVD
jgi:hypothetical protein